ncbi:TrmH family RNA methyltransferase [Gilvibacter sp.]|uniref:TrmH family RNA methyltransferase n=1 Tax=Gilvibacter sp. TaxID=2729997 RepID=UPI0025B9B47D|nr:TrmH family RNA methyltransferase [Gilvibacter sp.]
MITVLENPNFIMNIGNVIRNVNGLGVDELFVIDGQKRLEDDLEKIRSRKSILKNSNGAVKWTNVKVFHTTSSCFEYLKSNLFTNVATSPHLKTSRCFQIEKANLKIPKLAIWFGEESKGLSNEAFNLCDFSIYIKMRGKVESFNLSTSTGIVMYEAIRQRDCD